jgi:hypothetical protein
MVDDRLLLTECGNRFLGILPVMAMRLHRNKSNNMLG